MQQDLPAAIHSLERQGAFPRLVSCSTRHAWGDVSIAVHFRNLGFARQRTDAHALAHGHGQLVDRVLAQPAFTKLRAFEEQRVARRSRNNGRCWPPWGLRSRRRPSAAPSQDLAR